MIQDGPPIIAGFKLIVGVPVNKNVKTRSCDFEIRERDNNTPRALFTLQQRWQIDSTQFN